MYDGYSQFTHTFVNSSYVDRKRMIDLLCKNIRGHYIYDYVSRCNTHSINSEPYNIYEVISRLRALNNRDIDGSVENIVRT